MRPEQYTKQKTSDKGLLPYEIVNLVNKELGTPYYTGTLSVQFSDEVKEFINEFIVEPAVKFRKAYGMPGAMAALARNANPFGKADGMLVDSALYTGG